MSEAAAKASGEEAPRRSLRRSLARALLLVVGLVGSAALGFHLWVREGLAADAPRVCLSVGADLVNDVGLHQAAYQAVLRSLGAQAEQVTPRDGRTPAEILDGVDCLVLTGGGDVDPALYGGDSSKGVLVDRKRDEFELALLREALRRDMPVLAVCRGIQLMNVGFGGTLKDIRDDPALYRTHGITARSLVAHPVELAPGSKVRLLSGEERLEVNSFHGAVVDRLGPGLTVAARAPDGVVEAVEVQGATWALGIQWHPEMLAFSSDPARAVFERLLEQARAYRARRIRTVAKTARGA